MFPGNARVSPARASFGRVESTEPGELVGQEDQRGIVARIRNLRAQQRLALHVVLDSLVLGQLGYEPADAGSELVIQFVSRDDGGLEHVMQERGRHYLVMRMLSDEPRDGDGVFDGRVVSTPAPLVCSASEAIGATEERGALDEIGRITRWCGKAREALSRSHDTRNAKPCAPG